ncbi:MAG: hypothetical protein IVW57_00150 [Ktedonobacterales bacterium]|nr:hypothetical protein [Ktedonobacterales bacterium]
MKTMRQVVRVTATRLRRMAVHAGGMLGLAAFVVVFAIVLLAAPGYRTQANHPPVSDAAALATSTAPAVMPHTSVARVAAQVRAPQQSTATVAPAAAPTVAPQVVYAPQTGSTPVPTATDTPQPAPTATATVAPSPAPTATATATATPTPAPTWHTMGTWSGSTGQTLATIALQGTVRLDWTCALGAPNPATWDFQYSFANMQAAGIVSCNATPTGSQIVQDTTNASSTALTIIEDNGTMGNWTVTVEELY